MRKYSEFNIFENFKKIIVSELLAFASNDVKLSDLERVTCEAPKSADHGDLATNVAMVFCKDFAMKPRDLAEKLVQKIEILDDVEKVEIAGPGFINVTMTNTFWQKHLSEILQDPQNFSTSEMGQGEKINLEFASANPTGPLHVGHARGAVFGDSLACLLEKTGYEVIKEYYVNDAGSQVKTLVESLKIRYEELVTGKKQEIPQGLYPGEYLIEIAEKLQSKFGDSFLQDAGCEQILRDFALEQIMGMIKQDLKQLRIEHDVFTSERVLHESGMVEKMIAELQKKDLTYVGQLDNPKAFEKEMDEEEKLDQLIFKSTSFGDDSDRVIQKANGEMTYFAGDLAYMVDKINRGFSRQVLILGADHLGYRKRLQAAISALSEKKAKIDVFFVQIVNFLQNGEIFKMSKRQGTYVTIADVVEIVGVDVLRFIMLTRKNDALLDFDLEKVKEQSKDNPVFYVQYALARACSVLEKAKELNGSILENFENVDFSKLTHAKELELIKIISAYPRKLEMAASMMEPHRIAFYLIDLAACFHGFWNYGKEDENLKFITENEEITKARLSLVRAVIHVFHFGLEILKVEPKHRM